MSHNENIVFLEESWVGKTHLDSNDLQS